MTSFLFSNPSYWLEFQKALNFEVLLTAQDLDWLLCAALRISGRRTPPIRHISEFNCLRNSVDAPKVDLFCQVADSEELIVYSEGCNKLTYSAEFVAVTRTPAPGDSSGQVYHKTVIQVLQGTNDSYYFHMHIKYASYPSFIWTKKLALDTAIELFEYW